MRSFSEFLTDESGASAAEYALILALVAGVIIAGLIALGNGINGKIQNIATAINNSGS